MKIFLFLVSFALLFLTKSFAQDTIVLKTGSAIICNITEVENEAVYYINITDKTKVYDTLLNSEIEEIRRKGNDYSIFLKNKKTIQTDSIRNEKIHLIYQKTSENEQENRFVPFSDIETIKQQKKDNSTKVQKKFQDFRNKQKLTDSLAIIKKDTFLKRQREKLYLNSGRQILKHFALPTWAAASSKNYPDMFVFATGDALVLLMMGLIGGSGEWHIPFSGYMALFFGWRAITLPITISHTEMYNYRIKCKKEGRPREWFLGLGTEYNVPTNPAIFPDFRDNLIFYAGY